MKDNPITKKITRHVHGYWRGYSGLNAMHPPTWTVGLLRQIVADCEAAGYFDSTELKPEIDRDPSGLSGFRLSVTEDIADEIPVKP